MPADWEQKIADLLRKSGVMTPEKLNAQPMPTDEQGVVTDVRSNAEIWQEKTNQSGFAGAQSNIRAGLEPLIELLSNSPGDIGKGVMNSLRGVIDSASSGFGGTKTQNSPLPAPPQPKQDQLRFAQEASQPDRNQMQSRYMNDANARSQIARQVMREQELDGPFNRKSSPPPQPSPQIPAPRSIPGPMREDPFVAKPQRQTQRSNTAPAWAQQFLNAGPRRGGPQEF